MSSSIAARLNRLPITRSHRVIVFIAGIGTFFDLFDIFLAGVLGTVLTEQFHLSRVALPAVLGSGFLGMFIGAVTLGWFADRVGRRRAFLVNLGVYSAFTLLGAFSVNAPMLIVARFVAGIGIGAELPLIDAYLSEFLPAPHRGRYTAMAYTVGFVGVPAVGFLARVLVPLHVAGIAGWRFLFVIGSLGAAIVWRLRSQLPESPRWLEITGRITDAEAIVARLEAEAASAVPHEAPRDRPATRQPRSSSTTRGRMLMLCVFHVFQTVGYYGFGVMVPLVLAAKGFSIVTSLTYTSLVFMGYPIGSAVSMPVVDRIDRRWLIIASAILMSVFGLALGFAASPVLIIVFGCAYTIVSNIFSNAFHIFQAEIFPTSVRATASSTAYGLSRLSSAVMPFVLYPVLQSHGAEGMFAVLAAAMLIVVVDIMFFAPSTTGKPLEDVAAMTT